MSSKAMSKLSSRPFVFISAGLVLAALAIPPVAVGAILWPASEAILRPSGPGGVGEIRSCSQLAMQAWGTDCGRLSARTDIEKLPWEVQSDNEYMLSGWILRSNTQDEYRKVLLYVPGGGSDRREASRYVDLAHSLGFDLASFDPVCHGISPCIGHGVSYGDRESVDVRSAVQQLTASYRHVVVMGSSVGALSILRALPSTPGVDGVILENPMESLYQLLRDARESEGLPDWMVASLAGIVQLRAGSSAAPSAVEALRMADLPPLLFIHSKSDQLVPYNHICAESFNGRLTAFDIASDGALSNPRLWAQLEGQGGDGMCMDAEGAMWIAAGARCVRVAEGGRVLDEVPLDRMAFACMLGGHDGRTLYICANEWTGSVDVAARTGRLYSTTVSVPHAGYPRSA